MGYEWLWIAHENDYVRVRYLMIDKNDDFVWSG